jgi:hypothetical protein
MKAGIGHRRQAGSRNSRWKMAGAASLVFPSRAPMRRLPLTSNDRGMIGWHFRQFGSERLELESS